MKKDYRILLVLSLVMGLLTASLAYSWGFFAHQLITRQAIFILPQSMLPFYKRNINQIVEASIQPDIRRYVSDTEAPKHYIDLELFGAFQDSILFLDWKEAARKFNADSLFSRGTLPWAIENAYYDLVQAFKLNDPDLIIRYSADLSHYISDAHVPLHSTYNYDGQFTNQRGIHRLWESLIPETMAEGYSFWVGKAEYRRNIRELIRKTIQDSHAGVDSVLTFEMELSNLTDPDRKYAFQIRGRKEVKQHSIDYIQSYENMLSGMVERRMQASVKMTGDLWYSSWIEAGQPELGELTTKREKYNSERIENMKDTTSINRRILLHGN